MENNCLKSMHCYYLTTKAISSLKKIQRKWTQNWHSNLWILAVFGPPYHALTLKHCCVWCKWDGMVGSDGCFPLLVYYYSRWSFFFDVVALMMVISFFCLVFLVMVNSLVWCIHPGDGRLLLFIYCTWCWSSPFSHMLYLVMVISFFWHVGLDDGHFLIFVTIFGDGQIFLFICYS